MTAPSKISTDKPGSSPLGSDTASPEASSSQLDSPMSEPATTDDILPSFTPEGEPSKSQSAKESGGAIVEPAAEAALGEGESEEKVPPPELTPRDLWIDELHELTVLELHERFAELKMRPNPDKSRH